MSRQNTFGQRGVPPEQRRLGINPYSGRYEPLGGSGNFSALGGVDERLRAFMLMVYNYMGLGLLVTGGVAFATYAATVTGDPSIAAVWPDDGTPIQMTDTEYLTDLGVLLWGTPLSYVICFGPLAILLFTSRMWQGLRSGAALAVFIVVAALIGVSFSGLALTYTNGSIAQMFFATAAGFGSLSLFGYVTNKDLSGWGSFLWMGLWAVIAAIIINIFMQSEMLQFVLSVCGVIVFAGFTAYDTQMIKEAYRDDLSREGASHLAITGALDLYLDFVNMFRFLLVLFGQEE